MRPTIGGHDAWLFVGQLAAYSAIPYKTPWLAMNVVLPMTLCAGALFGNLVRRPLPGTLALAVIAAGLVNLGIATAYERSYGVLKRLGGSPLGRTGLMTAKVVAVAVIYWFLTYEPAGSAMLLIFGIAMGVMCWILIPTFGDVGPTAPVDPDWHRGGPVASGKDLPG